MNANPLHSTRFGHENSGIQVNQSNAPIQASFHYSSETSPKPYPSIPFSRDEAFVDRGMILEKIAEQCSAPSARVALSGLGGVGKSQLAIEFAHRLAARSPETWVFWVRSSSKAVFLQDFSCIGNRVKLPDRTVQGANIPKLVHDWLSDISNGKWFLVVDGADQDEVLFSVADGDETETVLSRYLPSSSNGSILITTRNEDIAFKLIDLRRNIHRIGAMTKTEALTLLQKKLELGNPEDAYLGEELVKELEYIPLAISQASAFIYRRTPRVTLSKYLEDFQASTNQRVRLLSYDSSDPRRDIFQARGASNAILSTWEISFDYIKSKRPSAADLLSLMSFFNPQGIPECLLKLKVTTKKSEPTKSGLKTRLKSMIHRIMHLRDTTPSTNRADNRSNSTTDASGDETDYHFEEDVKVLQEYGLIKYSPIEALFQMHALVQLATKRWLEAQGYEERFLKKFIAAMTHAFPQPDDGKWKACEELFPHVEFALYHCPTKDEAKIDMSNLVLNGAWYAFYRDMYSSSEKMALAAKRYVEDTLRVEEGDDIPRKSYFLLAHIYQRQQRLLEAQSLATNLVRTQKAKLGRYHDNTLKAMGLLADIHNDLDQLEEAEKLNTRVVKLYKAKSGSKSRDTLKSMDNLSRTYGLQGRWKKAQDISEYILGACRANLSEQDPLTLTAMHRLAGIYLCLGHVKEAEMLFNTALELSKETFGDTHLRTLNIMTSLSNTYRVTGQLDRAEQVGAKALLDLKRLMGEEDRRTLLVKNYIANIYRDQHRYTEAEQHQVEILRVLTRRREHKDSFTFAIMRSLALTYRDQGHLDKAEGLLVQAMEGCEECLGADHEETHISKVFLAEVLELQGKVEVAEGVGSILNS